MPFCDDFADVRREILARTTELHTALLRSGDTFSLALLDRDALILSEISYLDFSGIVGEDLSSSVTLKEAADSFFADSERAGKRLGLILPDLIFDVFRIAAQTRRFADMKLLSFGDMACITVLDGKTYAIDRENKQYRLRQRLYELEQQLPNSFIRINKSTLANEMQLERFAVTYSGGVDAVFKCGYREYVSRRCFAQIKRRFK